MVVRTKSLSYEEYLAMPEIEGSFEIIDGELIMSPGPSPEHQWIVGKLLNFLWNFVQKYALGVVLAAPIDVLIRRNPLQVRQPDILFLSSGRSGVTGRMQLRSLQLLEIAPDLVVEVLSPGNTRREMEERLKDYRKIGVRECWLVSPEAETVEVIQLTSEEAVTVSLLGIDGILRSEILEGFTLAVKEIFE